MDGDALARRVWDGLPTIRTRVLLRDRCGRGDLVQAVAGEGRRRGVDVAVEHRSNERIVELLGSTVPADWSAAACLARREFITDVDAVVVLGGWGIDLSGVDPEVVGAWAAAVHRVESEFEARRLPTLVVAVPSAAAAAALATSIDELDDMVEAAVLCPSDELRSGLEPLRAAVAAGGRCELRTPGCVLTVERGERAVHVDDGVIDQADPDTRAIVSNLPGGSVYWTVQEDATRGSVRLTDGTVVDFDGDGRVASGSHAGERISHLGVATNPFVGQPIGWTLYDEHRRGAVFLALGENRYLGGANASSINVDLVVDQPTAVVGRGVDAVTVVSGGQVTIS